MVSNGSSIHSMGFNRRFILSLIIPCSLFFIPLILYLQCTMPPLGHHAEDRLRELQSSLLAERGSALLHTWTDRELLTRVRNATSVLPVPERYSAVRKVLMPRTLPDPAGKVAFMFLTTGVLPFEPLWRRFFEGHGGLYNIYVHMDPFRFEAFDPESPFWGRLVPSRHTDRGSPSLVMAMKRLMANALLDDPRNGYFVLLSDSCVPLRGFPAVYRRLASSQQQSFIEVITESNLLGSRYNARGENVMQPEVPFEKFAVGSQWFAVTRAHAEMLVEEELLWSKFSIPCLPQVSYSSCYTEEHYFSTLMNMREPRGTTGYTLTYVNWPPDTDGHPTTYHGKDVNAGFLRWLQSLENGRYLFARKFDVDSVGEVMKNTDVLLKH